MPSFAVMQCSRSDYIDGILMILDDRGAAEEIAIALRRKGLDVAVEEFRGTVGSAHPAPDSARWFDTDW